MDSRAPSVLTSIARKDSAKTVASVNWTSAIARLTLPEIIVSLKMKTSVKTTVKTAVPAESTVSFPKSLRENFDKKEGRNKNGKFGALELKFPS